MLNLWLLFNPPSLTTDNDTLPPIVVTGISGDTKEKKAGEADFDIVLNAAPTADVTIGISSDDTTEGTVDPTSVTFTTGNWNVPQTITVTGVDDAIADGDILYHAVTAPATSSDTRYNGYDPFDVDIINQDDD